MSLVKLDLMNRYRRSVLGIGWSLLQPISMTIVLCVVFRAIMDIDIRDYAPFVLSGMVIWNFINSAVIEGCQSLYNGEKYIRTYSAPMAIYPLRTALGIMVHFLLTLLVLFAATALLSGFKAALPMLVVPPAVLLLFLFGWALTTIFGFITVYLPDAQYLSQIVLQLLFYLTPIFYPPEMMAKRGVGIILRLNPLGSFFELLRAPILHGKFPSLEATLVCSCTVAATVLLAVIMLRRCERRIIYYM
ncbi:MAG: ABC transporter permease [Pirellulales bacterium]